MTRPKLEWTKDRQRVIVNGNTRHPLSIPKAVRLYSTLGIDTVRSRLKRGATPIVAFFAPKTPGVRTATCGEDPKQQRTKSNTQLREEDYILCHIVSRISWTNSV